MYRFGIFKPAWKVDSNKSKYSYHKLIISRLILVLCQKVNHSQNIHSAISRRKEPKRLELKQQVMIVKIRNKLTIGMIRPLLKSTNSMISLIDKIEGNNMAGCYIGPIIAIYSVTRGVWERKGLIILVGRKSSKGTLIILKICTIGNIEKPSTMIWKCRKGSWPGYKPRKKVEIMIKNRTGILKKSEVLWRLKVQKQMRYKNLKRLKKDKQKLPRTTIEIMLMIISYRYCVKPKTEAKVSW